MYWLVGSGNPRSCDHVEGKDGGREILCTLIFLIQDNNTKPVSISCALYKTTAMDNFKESLTVHCKFPLLVFPPTWTYKMGWPPLVGLFL